jgi:D-alanyl-D-alanine dipeptidase
VAHNKQNLKNHGSCIFLHLLKTDTSPTAGCTAMKKSDMSTLISHLNPQKHPLLIQLPKHLWHDWKKVFLQGE